MNADEYGTLFAATLRLHDRARPRSQQTLDGVIGISDLFTCQEKVRRMIVGEQRGDDTGHMSAIVGTAVHAHLAEARQAFDPALTLNTRLVVTLPNGAKVPGTADEIDPNEPSVTDHKTVDGLGVVRRTGGTDQQRSQRHVYYAAAHQAGLVPPEGIVRNVWLDRSGRYDEVHVEQEAFNPAVVLAASDWLDDVLFAVKNAEPARKEPSLCGFCPFSVDHGGTCGAELSSEGRALTEQEAIAAALLEEARAREKQAKREAEDAKRALEGVDGAGHGWRVWHVNVNADPPYVTTKAKAVA